MRLTKNQKQVLRNVARNTPFSGNKRTLDSLVRKGLIRKLAHDITIWDLTETGNALYIKLFNVTPECW